MNEFTAPRSRAAAASAGMRRALALAEAEWTKLAAPGMTLAFVNPDGTAEQAALGLADTATGALMPVEARMPGGSTGKSVFAATALALAATGQVDLDRLLSGYLGKASWFPEVPNARDLTLRHLLMHSGGLPDHMGDIDTLQHFVRMRTERGPDYFLDPVGAIRRIERQSPVVPASGGFFYSDTGYILAGLGIEAATGESLYDLARLHVLEPNTLSDFAPAISRRISRTVQGYTNASEASGLPARMLLDDGQFAYSPASEWAGGGYVTSARDLARFIRLYASGRVTGAASLADAFRIIRYSWIVGQVGGYGIGLFASESPLGPCWSHGGYYPGYRSHMAYFPELDMSVAYQFNSSEAFSGYADIVAHRRRCASLPIDPDAPLTRVNDFAARLMAAFAGQRPD